jgi:DNA repair protein RecO (recombination protein O)
MIEKTRAIALHCIRYSETSVIAHLYTETTGRVSLMVKGALKPRSKFRAVYFEPFSLLEVELNRASGSSLRTPKELRLSPVLTGLRTDVRKTTLSLFLSELVYRCVREEQSDPALFHFLFQSVQILNVLPDGLPVFHLWFGFKLAGRLGFDPMQNYTLTTCYFNIHTGRFEDRVPVHNEYLGEEDSKWLAKLLVAAPEELKNCIPPSIIRNKLLDAMLLFFRRHHEGMKSLNSLAVLRELFHP